MRILFDQGTPVQIRRSLEAHTVKTSREQGWSTLANGELLRVAEEAGFDVLLTTDKNMRYQQNLEGRRIRSEEHTSELQSLTNLVCRLLLEKKKKKNNIT